MTRFGGFSYVYGSHLGSCKLADLTMLLLYLLTLPSPELQRPPLDGAVWWRHRDSKLRNYFKNDHFGGFSYVYGSHLGSCKLEDLKMLFLYLLTLTSLELERPSLDGAVLWRHRHSKLWNFFKNDQFDGFSYVYGSNLGSCKLEELKMLFVYLLTLTSPELQRPSLYSDVTDTQS